jgi:hypothetical protein
MDAVVDPNAAPPEPSQTAAVPSGAADLANTLLVQLTAGVDFEVPVVDIDDDIFDQPIEGTGPLYEPIDKITIDKFTTGQVGGTGMFDQIMVSLVNHLKVEYTASRIAGAEYTKAYIGAISSAMDTAQALLLGKDQAYYQALAAQQAAQMAEIQKVTARIELEVAKANLAKLQFEALTAEVNYAVSKISLSTADIAYANAVKQGAGIDIENTNKTKQGVGFDFTNANILPANHVLLKEQADVQRAQTLDNRADGQAVTGTLGKQKLLHAQQITSYIRDAETKLVKLYSDSWIAQKSQDDGLLAPDQFTNVNINEILVALRTNLNLGS